MAATSCTKRGLPPPRPDKLVKLESSVLQGDPVTELVELSASSQVICIGSRGIHDSPKHGRGSTARELAKRATSSVAVIHRRHRRALIHDKWIVFALDEALGSQVLLESAFDEALLRRAPILALTPSARTDRGTDSTDHRDPRARLEEYIEEAGDVQVCALPAPDDMASFLAQCADIGQLVIANGNSAILVAELVGPKARAVLHHTSCSILFLREQTPA